eukprot:GDKJ01049655.1.p2 GENE.GDKJ01049655.1~~GDKJ01049655.1.p2  ORF type:complete len:243 (-),score=66.88 GDKJ01049655.1:25-753(-)
MDDAGSILLRVDELQQRHFTNSNEIERLMSEITEVSSKMKTFEEDLFEVNREIEIFGASNIKKKLSCDRLQQEVEAMALKNKEMLERKNHLSQLIIEKENSIKDSFSGATTTVDEIDRHLKQLPKLLKKMQIFKDDLQSLTSEAAIIKKKRIEREQQLFDAAQMNQHLMRECVGFENKLKALDVEESQLRFQLNQIRQQIQEEECSNRNAHQMLDAQLSEVNSMLQMATARLNEARLMDNRL